MSEFFEGMEVHGASIFNNGIVLKGVDSFPTNPKLDSVIRKDGLIWTYALVQGVESWMPVTTQTNAVHLHIQGLASTTWTINHDQGTVNYLLVVYREDGTVITPATQVATSNGQIVLTFNASVKGKALVFFATAMYSPRVGSNVIEVQDQLTVAGRDVIVELDNRYTKAETDSAIDTAVLGVIGGAPEELDTLKEAYDRLVLDETGAASLTATVNTKADQATTYTKTEVDAIIAEVLQQVQTTLDALQTQLTATAQ